MAYLHDRKVVHRDLKGRNVLLDETYVPKIADFGLSKLRRGWRGGSKTTGLKISRVDIGDSDDGGADATNNMSMTAQVGTPAWMAPELITTSRKTKASHKVDIFSFGVLAWECFSRQTPYVKEIEAKRLKVSTNNAMCAQLHLFYITTVPGGQCVGAATGGCRWREAHFRLRGRSAHACRNPTNSQTVLGV
jgi:serine/threonine protein kinase